MLGLHAGGNGCILALSALMLADGVPASSGRSNSVAVVPLYSPVLPPRSQAPRSPVVAQKKVEAVGLTQRVGLSGLAHGRFANQDMNQKYILASTLISAIKADYCQN